MRSAPSWAFSTPLLRSGSQAAGAASRWFVVRDVNRHADLFGLQAAVVRRRERDRVRPASGLVSGSFRPDAQCVRDGVVDAVVDGVAVAVAIMVAIRTFLGWATVLEISGRWPWQAKQPDPS